MTPAQRAAVISNKLAMNRQQAKLYFDGRTYPTLQSLIRAAMSEPGKPSYTCVRKRFYAGVQTMAALGAPHHGNGRPKTNSKERAKNQELNEAIAALDARKAAMKGQ